MPRLVYEVDTELLKRMKTKIPWGTRQALVLRLLNAALDLIDSSENQKMAALQLANGLFKIELLADFTKGE